jgi:LmbE family N-acetylglucosaminyl deacetylase
VDEYLKESEIIPYHRSLPYGEKVLVLAPHPDDETIGCGGALRLLIEQGKHVDVLFLTSGEKAEKPQSLPRNIQISAEKKGYSLIREREARKALKRLGVIRHAFLRFPDREIFDRYDDVLRKITEVLLGKRESSRSAAVPEERTPQFDALYCPSPWELNPDHRASAKAVLELQKKYEFSIVFYEVASPIRPNMLVDISEATKIKWKALKCYRTQLDILDYLDINKALNRFRSLTLGKGTRYAEGFLLVRSASEQEDLHDWNMNRRPWRSS